MKTFIYSEIENAEEQFLSNVKEFKDKYNNDLPENCVFNKVITGCGGTTLALENNINYVIAVPTCELIMNKCHISKASVSDNPKLPYEVFGWFGSTKKKESNDDALVEYLNSHSVKKIMCTYDKVDDFFFLLKEHGMSAKDFRLLVDEYHCLFKHKKFRKDAIKGIWGYYQEYKSYTFMSATPIIEDFLPVALRGVNIYEMVWKKIDSIKPFLIKTNNPYAHLAAYINNIKKNGYLEVNGKRSKHLFIFLNSVSDIKSVIRHCELTPDDCRIICAEKNEMKLEEFPVSNSNYNPDKLDSANKMVTFLTCKAFEGADFWCTDALCIVVSNTHSQTTLVDITTDIPQIAGRIRNAEVFGKTILHIYNTTKTPLYDGAPILAAVRKRIEIEKEKVSKANSEMGDLVCEKVNYDMLNDSPFIDTIKDKKGRVIKYIFDEDALISKYYEDYKADIFYSSGAAIKAAYKSNDITEYAYTKWDTKIMRDNVCTFKVAFLNYIESREAGDIETANKWAKLYTHELNVNGKRETLPLMPYLYDANLTDKARELKYSLTRIKMFVDSMNTFLSTEAKIAKAVIDTFQVGKFYNNKEVKSLLCNIFSTFSADIRNTYNKKCFKATDIEKFFDAEVKNIRVDGKMTRGYVLLSPKVSISVSPKEEIIVEEDKQTKVDFEAIAYNEAIKEVELDKIKSNEFNPVDVIKSLYDKDFTISPKEIVEYLNEVHRFYGFEEQDVEQIIDNIWDSL